MERIWIKDREKPALDDLIKRIAISGDIAGNDTLTYTAGRMYETLEALKISGAVLCPQTSLDQIFTMDDAEFKALLKDIEGGGYVRWHISDIISSMKDEYPLINEEDAQAILSTMLDSHDAEYGISWESIRSAAQANNFDETHQSRMAKEFPFPLRKGELDWIDQYMTKETWEAGHYEEFLLSLTDDDYMRSMVTQLVRREHLICEFENHVAYYYFSLLRFSADCNFPVLAMLAPHLTAIMVREIMLNEEECLI